MSDAIAVPAIDLWRLVKAAEESVNSFPMSYPYADELEAARVRLRGVGLVEHDWHPGDDPSGLGSWCRRCSVLGEDLGYAGQDDPCPGRQQSRGG